MQSIIDPYQKQRFIIQEELEKAELIAKEIIRQTHPRKDLLSRRKANEMYGTRWVTRMIKRGLVKPVFGCTVNSPVYYSDAELKAAWNSEVKLKRLYHPEL